MNQALDKQAILDHYLGELNSIHPAEAARAGLPIVFAATSQDKRVIELTALFNRLDERGRQTALRMLSVMPYKEAT